MSAASDLATALALFSQWLTDAELAGIIEPSAMALATASKTDSPSVRMVLLKQFDDRGFTFYTNLGSRKASEIAENRCVALLFSWPELGREVHITGHVEPVDAAEAEAYFASRPIHSRIGAWASRQSRPLSNRFVLLCRVARFAVIAASGQLKCPIFWSGFRVIPDEISFWDDGDVQMFSNPTASPNPSMIEA